MPAAITENLEILMVALVLIGGHLISPRVAARRMNQPAYKAFSGGVSIGYVFLHLLPALDAGHAVVGKRIYAVALLGFVLFYGLDVVFKKGKSHHPTKYHAFLAALFIYDGLVVFTLGMELPPTAPLTAVFALSLALDLVSTDVDMERDFGSRFVRSGRWVLIAAVVAGYLFSLVRRPHELVIDVLTAALAGFMMFNVFSSTFPITKDHRFPAFLAGLVLFVGMHVVLGGAG